MRVKNVFLAALLCTTSIVFPERADAAAVGAFFTGIGVISGAAVTGGVAGTAYSIGAFLGQTFLGQLISLVGLSYLQRQRTQATDTESAQVNSRVPAPVRRMMAGSVKVAGDVGAFHFFDSNENLWYIATHGDSELLGDPTYYLAGIQVTVAEYDTVMLDDVYAVSETDIDLTDGPSSVGGIDMATGYRVLLTGQTDATENGVYVCTKTYIDPDYQYDYARASDMAAASTLANGTKVKVLTENEDDEGEQVFDADDVASVWEPSEFGYVVGTSSMSFDATNDKSEYVAGDVLTEEFCLNEDKDGVFNPPDDEGEVYERNPRYTLWTVTPDPDNIYGAKPAAFTSAFPDLPSDFYLAGVCYTIVRQKSMSLEQRFYVTQWGGAIGLGEPSVAIVGDFERMYDPRNVAHDIDDRSTWTSGGNNPALIWAWFWTHDYGMGRSMDSVNWDLVADCADICEEQVLNRSGEYVDRYQCHATILDSTKRGDAQAKILATMDGYIARDDDGLAYPIAGKYEAPSLTFSGSRDIYDSRTEIIDDGESAVDGVIVEYTSPDHEYTTQDCYPWQNPEYYVDGTVGNYQRVTIEYCQDHNQAFRLAGAIGARAQASKKAAITCGLKGLLATNVRSITLDLDDEFSGGFEIATPVKRTGDGRQTSFAVVPLSSDRWDGAGQTEGEPPDILPSQEVDSDVSAPGNMTITLDEVTISGGTAVRFGCTFDEPDNIDRYIQVRFSASGFTDWDYFTINMDTLSGYSAILTDGQEYDLQWQTVTSSGKASGWKANGASVYTVTAVANSTAPADLVAASATGGVGEVDLTWTTANDANQYAVKIWRGTTTTYGDADLVSTIVTAANTSGSATDESLAAATYYYWMEPINASGVGDGTGGGAPANPYTAVVT